MIPPLHNNTQFANQTNYWSGADSLSKWQFNIRDSKKYEFFKKHGWDTETSIVYKFNSHGFRCAEFDNTPAYLALGCSFTEGVGLRSEEIWPYILSEKLSQPVLNLGVGGSSLDTCFRLLDYYLNKLNVLGVFILEPYPTRFELFTMEQPITMLPAALRSADSDLQLVYKYWVTDPHNIYYNTKKNRLAIQMLCQPIKLISLPCTDIDAQTFIPQARDLMHAGNDWHQCVASKFLNELSQTI